MAEFFKEVFGFEPEVFGTTKAGQLVVDAVLSNLAHRIVSAGQTLNDLRRALAKVITDSKSVMSFATAMAKVENNEVQAKAVFDEAVRIAKAAGFAALGTVENFEAKRIFGLEEVHQPLSAGERVRITERLKVLAAKFHLARALEIKDRQKGARNVESYNALLEAIAPAKDAFWAAYNLASQLGANVSKTYEEHLPYLRWRDIEDSYYNQYTIDCLEEFLKQ